MGMEASFLITGRIADEWRDEDFHLSNYGNLNIHMVTLVTIW